MRKIILGLLVAGLVLGCGGGSSGSGDSSIGQQGGDTGSGGGQQGGGTGSGGSQQDRTSPTLTLKGEQLVEILAGTVYVDAGATANDNIDGDITSIITTTNRVNTEVTATYYVSYNVTDASGNSAREIRRIVKVVGIEFSFNNNVTVPQYSDIFYDDPGYQVKSSYEGAVNVKRSDSVDMDVLGAYTLTYLATDAHGNTRTLKRTVTVVENPNINILHASNVTQFRKALEDASSNGSDDIILLTSGIYKTSEDGFGTFDFNDDENHILRIHGEVSNTILDGDDTNRVLDFDNTKNGNIILKHLDLRNGRDDDTSGISSEEYLILVDCKVHDGIGRGIYAEVGTLIIDSEIYNNVHVGDSRYTGGGIYSNDTTRVYRSKIYNNRTEYSGGGIYSKNDLSIYGSEVYGNILSYDSTGTEGAGIYIYKSTHSIIDDTLIHHNISAHGDGGGVFSYYRVDLLSIIKSKIYANKAGSAYGGVYAGKNLYMSKSEVKDNNATVQGGISVYNQLNMYDSNVTGNLSTDAQKGGGIYIYYWASDDSIISSSNISRNTIINNYSYSYLYRDILGAGVYAHGRQKNLTIENTVIANNKAIFRQGGDAYGVAIFANGNLNMINNTIVNNESQNSDSNNGAIYGKGNFHNNIIDNNMGAINFQGDSKVFNNYVDYTTFLNENTYTVIKKENIIPKSGDVNYNADFTLAVDSMLINRAATPTTTWWSDDYYDNIEYYDAVIRELESDIVGNLRDDGVVDMGAYEYKE